jgi:hypothetical protein
MVVREIQAHPDAAVAIGKDTDHVGCRHVVRDIPADAVEDAACIKKTGTPGRCRSRSTVCRETWRRPAPDRGRVSPTCVSGATLAGFRSAFVVAPG